MSARVRRLVSPARVRSRDQISKNIKLTAYSFSKHLFSFVKVAGGKKRTGGDHPARSKAFRRLIISLAKASVPFFFSPAHRCQGPERVPG